MKAETWRLYKLVTLTLFMVFSLGFMSAAERNMLEEADSAYQAKNFRKALSLYENALDKKGASTELYYNIGNAHYRLGNVGKAILSYERALKVNPANKDARTNLEYVRSNLKGLPEDGSSFLSNMHQKVTATASPDTWGIVAFVLFLLLLGCVSIYLFANNPSVRKFGFFGGICLLVVFTYCFIIAWQTASAHSQEGVGIVIRQNARLTSNPGTAANKSEKTIAIPEGSKVEIVDSLATPNDPVTTMWYNVVLNNKSEAWIDASDVEMI